MRSGKSFKNCQIGVIARAMMVELGGGGWPEWVSLDTPPSYKQKSNLHWKLPTQRADLAAPGNGRAWTLNGRHLEERVDHRAFGDLIARAARGHVRHNALQPFQVHDFLPDVREMLNGERVHLRASIGVAIDQAQ